MRRDSGRKVCLAYFYFNYQNSGRTAENVVTSLLKQMVQRLNKLPQHLVDEYKQWADDHNYRPEGKNLADILSKCSRKFHEVFVVLEALNECPPKEMTVLYSLINEWLETTKIKFYITARSYLKNDLKKSIRTTFEPIQIQANPDDIEKFVESQLQSPGWRDRDSDQKHEIVRRIQDNANGMSVWFLSSID